MKTVLILGATGKTGVLGKAIKALYAKGVTPSNGRE
jgi:hypothetical protein